MRTGMLPLVALLLLLGRAGVAAQAAGPAAAAAAPAASVRAPAPAPEPPLDGVASRAAGKLTFCIPEWKPFSMCNPDQPATEYTGFDPELVRTAARDMGLEEGIDWQFKCVPFSRMIESLKNSSGECSASSTGVTITTERQDAGIRFTYPTYKSSLGILVKSSTSQGSGWSWINPFSWSLWVALALTLVVFPPVIFLIEFLSLRRRIHKDDVAPGIIESSWRTALTLLLFDAFTVTSHGARIVVLIFMFLALLVTSTYTANLAAFVTINSIRTQIDGVADLRGRAVGTSPVYLERLKKYGVQGTPLPFNKGSDYLTWADQVRSGELVSLVRDLPALQWLANTAPSCDIAVLSQTIEPFDYGIAFHRNSSDALVSEWSRAVLTLQEQGVLNQLRDSWIFSADGGCQAFRTLNKGPQAVQFSDMYGLWVVLGAGCVAGALFMLGQRWTRSRGYAKWKRNVASVTGIGRDSKSGKDDDDVMPQEGRQGRRGALVASVRKVLPRGRPRAASTKDGRASKNSAQNGATPPVSARSARSASEWEDLESGGGSGSLTPAASLTPPAPAAAAARQQQQLAPSPFGAAMPTPQALAAGLPPVPEAEAAAAPAPETAGEVDLWESMERKTSALLTVESVFESGRKWKSAMHDKDAS